jgi:hypothetical protein
MISNICGREEGCEDEILNVILVTMDRPELSDLLLTIACLHFGWTMAIVPPIVTDLLLCMVGEGEVEGKRRTAAPGISCWKVNWRNLKDDFVCRTSRRNRQLSPLLRKNRWI